MHLLVPTALATVAKSAISTSFEICNITISAMQFPRAPAQQTDFFRNWRCHSACLLRPASEQELLDESDELVARDIFFYHPWWVGFSTITAEGFEPWAAYVKNGASSHAVHRLLLTQQVVSSSNNLCNAIPPPTRPTSGCFPKLAMSLGPRRNKNCWMNPMSWSQGDPFYHHLAQRTESSFCKSSL